jgi:uncharacterized membrane protein YedE/YeeE
MSQTLINAVFGGLLIGVAVSLMLLFNGRVTGISGIVNGIITPQKGDTVWRIFFVVGLLLGGLILNLLRPGSLLNSLPTSDGVIFIAGLLVGFGTIMGSGCTSGHGICGFSRLSPRSFLATLVFISAGVLSVYLFKSLGE